MLFEELSNRKETFDSTITLVFNHISTKTKFFESKADGSNSSNSSSNQSCNIAFLQDSEVNTKLNRKITVTGRYSSIKQQVSITFSSIIFKHEPIGWQLCYHYKDQPRSVKYNLNEVNYVRIGRSTVVNISTLEVEPHVFHNTFILRFRYAYEDIAEWFFQSEFHFDVPFNNNATDFEFVPLGHFRPSKLVIEIFEGDCEHNPGLDYYLQEINEYCLTPLKDRPYRMTLEMLKMAQSIEDLYSQRELSKMTLKNIEIKAVETLSAIPVYGKDGRKEMLYSLEMENGYAGQLNSMDFKEISMKIALKIGKGGRRRSKEMFVSGRLQSIAGNRIYFYSSFDFNSNTSSKNLVSFEFNRISTRATINALKSICPSLMPYLSDFAEPPFGWKDEYSNYGHKGLRFADEDFVWFNPQLSENKEQQTAVRNIVNCTAFPFPYVIFGPPGTGKTSTLVECVAQISKLRPEANILITAQSNSACDEIGARLLKAVPLSRILRIYSAGIEKDKMKTFNPILVASSNFRSGKNVWPTKEEFNWFSIVIVTLMSSSRLVQSDIREGHFDYIFLDECGAASEPESLLPILGLGSRNSFDTRRLNIDFNGPEITSNIVILGDHKQLGAVINSLFAEMMGLGISLMERMMTKDRYKPNPDFDTNYVTQLLDNYRCHQAILQFSNKQFYDNLLRSKIPEDLRMFAEKFELLPNPNFPIIFHCLKEVSKIDPQGTSSYNDAEVEQVKFYVSYLLTKGINGKRVKISDIGIISPYLAQLKKLRNVLTNEIEIGTAEYFQGREKKIVIISTVKSGAGVGFLKSEKRLNVILTRAQSLMIIVGNAETLQSDQLWKSFIHYCHINQAFTRDAFDIKAI